MSEALQPGPCVVCGERNYPMSMGGPSICPICDCGAPPAPRLRSALDFAESRVVELEAQVAELTRQRKAEGERAEKLVIKLSQALDAMKQSESRIVELEAQVADLERALRELVECSAAIGSPRTQREAYALDAALAALERGVS